MTKNFILKTLTNSDLESEVESVGFDISYAKIFTQKLKYINIKIFDLSVAQTNILKQTALSVGADCATNRDVITGKCEISDAILGGSYAQLHKITQKLLLQPFNLKLLASNIDELLEKLESTETKTKLVGILNITENSFSDGGLYLDIEKAKDKFQSLISDGADIIDIGAESTKPFSTPISDKIQIERLLPIVDFSEKYNIPISIDTRSSVVAEEILKVKNCIINDVSGFEFDKQMPSVIEKYGARVIIQHSKGSPENMQCNPEYNNLIDEIYFSLKKKIETAQLNGIDQRSIIIDPGIGFGKRKEHNIEIINRALEFKSLGCPLMLGISRKSFLGIDDNNNELKDALSLGYGALAIQQQVDYLRVHNVKMHKAFLASFYCER